jgi:hypothetical protein
VRKKEEEVWGGGGPHRGNKRAARGQSRSSDGERRRWLETRGEAKLGARTRGFRAENEYREEWWSSGHNL